MEDNVLLVEANYLKRDEVEDINKIALAFNMAGATVIFFESVPPNPNFTRLNKLKRLGYNFDELIQVEQMDTNIYDLDALKIVDQLLSDGSSLTVLTGSAMVFQRLERRGLRGFLYG